MTQLDKALELKGEIKGKTCPKEKEKSKFIDAWRLLSEDDKLLFKVITATVNI